MHGRLADRSQESRRRPRSPGRSPRSRRRRQGPSRHRSSPGHPAPQVRPRVPLGPPPEPPLVLFGPRPRSRCSTPAPPGLLHRTPYSFFYICGLWCSGRRWSWRSRCRRNFWVRPDRSLFAALSPAGSASPPPPPPRARNAPGPPPPPPASISSGAAASFACLGTALPPRARSAPSSGLTHPLRPSGAAPRSAHPRAVWPVRWRNGGGRHRLLSARSVSSVFCTGVRSANPSNLCGSFLLCVYSVRWPLRPPSYPGLGPDGRGRRRRRRRTRRGDEPLAPRLSLGPLDPGLGTPRALTASVLPAPVP